jgi:hypothetical protein
VGGGCQATVTLLFSALHSSGMMAGAAGAAKYEKRIAMWLGSGATERENPKGNTLGDNDATEKGFNYQESVESFLLRTLS